MIITEEVAEFIRESNAIEGEYSKIAFDDACTAYNYAYTAMKDKKKFTKAIILNIHKRLMHRLSPSIAGKFRTVPVYIGGREAINASQIKDELNILCSLPATTEEFIKKWHIEFERIHPHQDGNGRTGRIIMNIQRIKLGLPILTIHEGLEQIKYYTWFKQ
jgi:Fic family protein